MLMRVGVLKIGGRVGCTNADTIAGEEEVAAASVESVCGCTQQLHL